MKCEEARANQNNVALLQTSAMTGRKLKKRAEVLEIQLSCYVTLLRLRDVLALDGGFGGGSGRVDIGGEEFYSAHSVFSDFLFIYPCFELPRSRQLPLFAG